MAVNRAVPTSWSELVRTSGKINFLRVNDVGATYGPPDDRIDAEVIFGLEGHPERFGFTLRSDDWYGNRHGMFHFVLAAFRENWDVEVTYRKIHVIGRVLKNFMLHTIWATK